MADHENLEKQLEQKVKAFIQSLAEIGYEPTRLTLSSKGDNMKKDMSHESVLLKGSASAWICRRDANGNYICQP